jgi:hypothetical protein
MAEGKQMRTLVGAEQVAKPAAWFVCNDGPFRSAAAAAAASRVTKVDACIISMFTKTMHLCPMDSMYLGM